MKIREKLIKLLGGEIPNKDSISIEVDTKTYYIDEDSLTFEKEQLAYKLGKELLDNDLIDFKVLKQYDCLWCKIYSICARICIKK